MYTPAPATSSNKLVKLVVVHTTTNNLENVLKLQMGDVVTCEPQDWAEMQNEWVWVINAKTKESGYYPREWMRAESAKY